MPKNANVIEEPLIIHDTDDSECSEIESMAAQIIKPMDGTVCVSETLIEEQMDVEIAEETSSSDIDRKKHRIPCVEVL